MEAIQFHVLFGGFVEAWRDRSLATGTAVKPHEFLPFSRSFAH
jgi:hypothetical protein